MNKRISLLGLMLLSVIVLWGQTPAAPFIGVQAKIGVDSAALITLPPLDSLLLWAKVHSPVLKQADAQIVRTQADYNRVKKLWQDGIVMSGNIRMGSFGNEIFNQSTLGYAVGPAVAFSLYDISSQKYTNQVFKQENEIAKGKREELEQSLRLTVITLYNNLKSRNNLVIIKSDAVLGAFTHLKMAETEYKQGAIALSELSRVTDIYNNARAEFEVAKNDLTNAFMQLEEIVGHPLKLSNGQK